jgi:DNA-binding transcriptional regulator YiaG
MTFDWTSAAGAMITRPLRDPVLVGSMLAGLGTSTADALPPEMVMRATQPTTAGASIELATPAGPAIAEVRRLTGLTWDQLARLFGVSRRSLHFWASGKAMTPSNEEHLQRVLGVVRKIDRGSAGANRAVLVSDSRGGIIPFDLLADRRYERVVALLGHGAGPGARPPKLSAEAMAARAPRPPGELVGALQDRVHRDTGVHRAAKSVRTRSGR